MGNIASSSGCLVFLYNKVYNLASYRDKHLGGPNAIQWNCGKDAKAGFACNFTVLLSLRLATSKPCEFPLWFPGHNALVMGMVFLPFLMHLSLLSLVHLLLSNSILFFTAAAIYLGAPFLQKRKKFA
jgi:hypothetical protein